MKIRRNPQIRILPNAMVRKKSNLDVAIPIITRIRNVQRNRGIIFSLETKQKGFKKQERLGPTVENYNKQ